MKDNMTGGDKGDGDAADGDAVNSQGICLLLVIQGLV
jgi:hypothetical protein